MTEEEKFALLQKSARRLTLICSVTLLVGVLILRFTAQNTDFNARRWLMFSALVIAGQFWYLRRVLHQNHHPNSDQLYPDLGPRQPADNLPRPRLRLDGRIPPPAPAGRTNGLAASTAIRGSKHHRRF